MPSLMPASTRLTWAAVGWAAGFVASVVATVAAAIVLGGAESLDTEQNLMESVGVVGLVLLQVPLWLGLLGTPLMARRYGLDWRRQLGWTMRLRDAPVGIGIGLATQLVAVPLLYWPIFRTFGDLDVEEPARELTNLAGTPLDVALLVVMTVVMAPVSEEVFFRGLVQGALHDRIGPTWAVAISSMAFAITHFQLQQFPAVLLVGVVHGLLVLRTGRLGSALWSHAGFNAVTVAVLLS